MGRIWELCDGTYTLEEIITVIAEEFLEDREVLRNILKEFFNIAEKYRLIIWVEGLDENFAFNP